MAVEARHLCLFPPQILSNRETVNGIAEGHGINMFGGGPMGYGPLSGTTTATDTTLIPPVYGTTMADTIPVKTPIKSDSGLTYSIPAVSRKRSRDIIAGIADHRQLLSFPPQNISSNHNHNRCGSFSFLGEDISPQIQQQQIEIDRFIAQHTAKVKMEIEERRKSYSRRIISAVEESVMKKLRVKEEEIDKIGRLNWALEEKVKSLCVENQIWRELAQTNEATANALRNNLEQVLLAQQQVQGNKNQNAAAAGNGAGLLEEDAESCCGSNLVEDIETVQHKKENNTSSSIGGDDNMDGSGALKNKKKKKKGSSERRRLCRNCGKDEASVLVLPCRHLCLCCVCGPSLRNCPICLCTKNGTLHVNL